MLAEFIRLDYEFRVPDNLDDPVAQKTVGALRQADLYRAGLTGRRPMVPISSEHLASKALARMSSKARAYIEGGAGLERTAASNRAAFDRFQILPRMLSRRQRVRDLSVKLLGRTLPLPILIAPIGVLELAHATADRAAARAAAMEGIPFVLSSQSSFPMEDVAELVGPVPPRWFQLYWSASDELTRSFVQRAELAGYSAIVVTLDTTELSWRPRDLQKGYLPFARGRGIANYLTDRVFQNLVSESSADQRLVTYNPRGLPALLELIRFWPEGPLAALSDLQKAAAAVRRFLDIYSRPDLNWDDLPFLRNSTRLPIVLKGILHPDDARRAVDFGVEAIIVSNHGGRQLDGAVGALEALPAIVEAVDARCAVLFDSGIRTGADVFKALCLGADAVLIGRPYVYGLALAGEAGVRSVIRNLAAELDLTLAIAGASSVRELNRSYLVDNGNTGPIENRSEPLLSSRE